MSMDGNVRARHYHHLDVIIMLATTFMDCHNAPLLYVSVILKVVSSCPCSQLHALFKYFGCLALLFQCLLLYLLSVNFLNLVFLLLIPAVLSELLSATISQPRCYSWLPDSWCRESTLFYRQTGKYRTL